VGHFGPRIDNLSSMIRESIAGRSQFLHQPDAPARGLSFGGNELLAKLDDGHERFLAMVKA